MTNLQLKLKKKDQEYLKKQQERAIKSLSQ